MSVLYVRSSRELWFLSSWLLYGQDSVVAIHPSIHQSSSAYSKTDHGGSRRSRSEGANKTTLPTKSRDEIVWPPNWTPSGTWMHLEMLSIKIMNRTCDKGQPCRSPSCTGNNLTYCRQCEPSSCSGRTGQPLATDPILPEHLPQDDARDRVECLLQIHKTHVDWFCKLPCTLQHPGKGIELVQCSTTRTKTALFLLNPRFYYRPNSPLQYPGIDFPGEAEECDPL